MAACTPSIHVFLTTAVKSLPFSCVFYNSKALGYGMNLSLIESFFVKLKHFAWLS